MVWTLVYSEFIVNGALPLLRKAPSTVSSLLRELFGGVFEAPLTVSSLLRDLPGPPRGTRSLNSEFTVKGPPGTIDRDAVAMRKRRVTKAKQFESEAIQTERKERNYSNGNRKGKRCESEAKQIAKPKIVRTKGLGTIAVT